MPRTSKIPTKDITALKRRIKSFQYGLPEDQLTGYEKYILAGNSGKKMFENDRGYIKIKNGLFRATTYKILKDLGICNASTLGIIS